MYFVLYKTSLAKFKVLLLATQRKKRASVSWFFLPLLSCTFFFYFYILLFQQFIRDWSSCHISLFFNFPIFTSPDLLLLSPFLSLYFSLILPLLYTYIHFEIAFLGKGWNRISYCKNILLRHEMYYFMLQFHM